MTSSADKASPALSLRERKKIKTRASIREHAMRLFSEQGYHDTTVGQIAEAAEISQTTFFRYFSTKEDVVLHDDLAPLFIEALRAQPLDLSSIAALRATVRLVFESMDDWGSLERQRHALIVSVPELRARLLEDFAGALGTITEVIAERIGRKRDDLSVRALVGAVMGVALAAYLSLTEDPGRDMLSLTDTGLAHLEAGFRL
ncbi:TetR family transcriptional regulator [Streptomyces sp. YIM 98790]|uniref:acyl-CoA-like ligand-binding transcription factor n=1 Tax=Streptomyces sp. YIM 98790 TaxID=2689077 RepID=UPI00140B18B3|nr:TetR family transcriptional regulator [Streptomyces sp. YIM 98790]